MADQQHYDNDSGNASLYRDLREFLQSRRADVRCEATRAVLDLVQSGGGGGDRGGDTGDRDGDGTDDTDEGVGRRGVGASGLQELLANIPDLVPLLAKNCSLASRLHPDDDAEEEEDSGVLRSRMRDSMVSARAALHALKALLVMTSHSVGPISQRCVEELLDASSSPSTSSASGMNRMMEILLTAPPGPSNAEGTSNDPLTLWRQLVNHAMALVVNMTRTEEGAVELVGRSLPDEAVASSFAAPHASDAEDVPSEEQLPRPNDTARLPNKPTIELLLARFLNVTQYADPTVNYRAMLHDQSGGDSDATTELALSSHHGDPFQHFASVLMNVAQVEAGRLFILKIHRKPTQEDKDGLGWSVLQALLPQLRSPNPLRRRGVAGTVRNCCLDPDFTWWLLNVVKISTHVLYPLAGPEELDVDEKRGLDPDLWLEGPDKEREADHLTRLYLVESVLFLASSGRKAQETLRRERVSVVLRWAEMVEEQEDVSEKMVECIDLLRDDTKDAGNDDRGDENDEEAYASTIGAPSAAKQVGLTVSDNYDDID